MTFYCPVISISMPCIPRTNFRLFQQDNHDLAFSVSVSSPSRSNLPHTATVTRQAHLALYYRWFSSQFQNLLYFPGKSIRHGKAAGLHPCSRSPCSAKADSWTLSTFRFGASVQHWRDLNNHSPKHPQSHSQGTGFPGTENHGVQRSPAIGAHQQTPIK